MKTLKEFDYDLWAIEENGRKRYFARIKATGEETEVSLEVMRCCSVRKSRCAGSMQNSRPSGRF